MYYGHLRRSDFVPLVKKFRKKGRGYAALVVNESTGFNREISFTELDKMLKILSHGYRVSYEIANYVNNHNSDDLPSVLFKIKMDIRLRNCIVE